jgi:SAM-dependent methyltransferase
MWGRMSRLLKRFREKGALAVVRHVFTVLLEEARTMREERRHRISTAGRVSSQDLGLPNSSFHCYSPTGFNTFDIAMKHVVIRDNEDVFVDVGSGKGRVLILAGRYAFKKIIGIEMSRELNDLARENIRQALPNLRCKDIEVLQTPAELWTVPDDVTLFFFFNPFKGDCLAAFMNNLRSSLNLAPRKATIIYVRPRDFFEKQIAWQEWLDKKIELPCREDTVAIYESKSRPRA